ncbi:MULTISPECIES: homoserine dehydrogenase [unclassified Fusibacter]|uniref:homoserine dehydrogenase n=1 Tax=unclassified Fusibacter TaxID=2624464 RepID=UPI00101186D8|nr:MULTISPECIES: homoserine dehydrogenase [unclassified Fusibacter]MCK8060530.1 homoserine dehydrogenase [Fusibacter sp. A2]NPE20181.1 homoserine dehydrogenase [Fusibacter sp. A1]RXV63391.1 homoserine dehydrogenase [Fusibacter sp. A1]
MKLGLLGFGTVGSGVADIVKKHEDRLLTLVGEAVSVKTALVRNLDKYAGTRDDVRFTTNADHIVDDPEIDVVVEVLGGIDTAYAYIKRALINKKHVITANKAVIAAHYPELQALANSNHVNLMVEACVAGGIPVISTLEEHLLHGESRGIHGILNGTGNFILSKIEHEGGSFDEALKVAQENGYAEAIPDDDVDGYDAARKIIILTALAHGTLLSLGQLWIESLRQVAPVDFEQVKKLGCTIRYVASSSHHGTGVSVLVRPVIVKKASDFGQTEGVDNCTVFEHENLNRLVLKGPGAGKLATANAVLADLVRLKGKSAGYKPVFTIATEKSTFETSTYYVRTSEAILRTLEKEYPATELSEGYALVSTNDPVGLRQVIDKMDSKAFLAQWLV